MFMINKDKFSEIHDAIPDKSVRNQ
jgi:hypothetical protein